jgi:hypothetical protein
MKMVNKIIGIKKIFTGLKMEIRRIRVKM